MPHKTKTKATHHLRNIISFRVSDRELDLLERLRGNRKTKLSAVLRELLQQMLDRNTASNQRRQASRNLRGVPA